MVGAHLHHVGIEEHGIDGFVERVVERTERGAQPLFGEAGNELLIAVMVVQAGGEPKALDVGDEGLEILRLAIAAVVAIKQFRACRECGGCNDRFDRRGCRVRQGRPQQGGR